MTKREKIKMEFNLLLKFLKQQERQRNRFIRKRCKQAWKVMRKQWGPQIWELHNPNYVRDCRQDLKFVDSSEL